MASAGDVTKIELNRTQALNLAKYRAGIPRSQQPCRQWKVGDDVTKKGCGCANYEYSSHPMNRGMYYEYVTQQVNKVIGGHTKN